MVKTRPRRFDPALGHHRTWARRWICANVSLADGAVAHFAVTAVASYLKTQFPGQQVYGSHGFRALQLVTCGGQFDSSTGHYLSNIVVYTSLVATTPPGQM